MAGEFGPWVPYVVVIYGCTSADLVSFLFAGSLCFTATTLHSLCLCRNITFCFPSSLQTPQTHTLHDRRRLWRKHRRLDLLVNDPGHKPVDTIAHH